MNKTVNRRFAALGFVMLLSLIASVASAHFLLNLNVRIFHVEHLESGLRIYARTPMPYLVADKMGQLQDSGLPQPAPFTTNALEDGNLMHFVDLERVKSNPLELGRLMLEGLVIKVGGVQLVGEPTQLRMYSVGTQPDFATLNEAGQSFLSGDPFPNPETKQYVGDTVIDAVFHFPTKGSITSYSISSTLDPHLPGQENTANLILDYGAGQPLVFRSRGLMLDPIEIERSPISAIRTFVFEGFRHILEGLDHVLFVVCLVLGAHGLHSLLWRVTGFTLGHSATLAIGFFGFVPTGAWFVPTVEIGIALSIIYAAAIAIRPTRNENNGAKRMFFVTCGIGLLHGLGFSFVLQNILQVTSPNIWQSLLAFNIGVEFGQLAIVLLVWPLMHFLRYLDTRVWYVARFATALACISIASIWTIQRLESAF